VVLAGAIGNREALHTEKLAERGRAGRSRLQNGSKHIDGVWLDWRNNSGSFLATTIRKDSGVVVNAVWRRATNVRHETVWICRPADGVGRLYWSFRARQTESYAE